MPRAWWVGGQRVVPAEDAQLAAIAEPGFDPRREAIVGEPVEGLPETPAEPGGRARITAYEPDRVELTAQFAAAAASSCSPTCTSRAGRRRSTAARCRSSASTTCCAASRSMPGEHRIVMTYEPWSWRAGLDRQPARGARAARGRDVEGCAAMSFVDRVRTAADPRALGALVQRSLKHADRTRGVYPALGELARRYGRRRPT